MLLELKNMSLKTESRSTDRVDSSCSLDTGVVDDKVIQVKFGQDSITANRKRTRNLYPKC